ncbi:hypothetical protein E4O04_01960 [Treponema sp. OMZ 799]|uniref:hypothetical protein n=1 Tax=Treponema sp. OMZ 799 TaxID=2563668 RepID=UPI0020A246F5|nr:hypothetical protein [Treponema sp. OMZ 799]UTC76844.1 hypothetical protein E4O04_01960 [Treponema sp. OMZ 799]
MYKKILNFLLLGTLILLFFSACPTGLTQNNPSGQGSGGNDVTIKPAEKGVIKGVLKYDENYLVAYIELYKKNKEKWECVDSTVSRLQDGSFEFKNLEKGKYLIKFTGAVATPESLGNFMQWYNGKSSFDANIINITDEKGADLGLITILKKSVLSVQMPKHTFSPTNPKDVKYTVSILNDKKELLAKQSFNIGKKSSMNPTMEYLTDQGSYYVKFSYEGINENTKEYYDLWLKEEAGHTPENPAYTVTIKEEEACKVNLEGIKLIQPYHPKGDIKGILQQHDGSSMKAISTEYKDIRLTDVFLGEKRILEYKTYASSQSTEPIILRCYYKDGGTAVFSKDEASVITYEGNGSEDVTYTFKYPQAKIVNFTMKHKADNSSFETPYKFEDVGRYYVSKIEFTDPKGQILYTIRAFEDKKTVNFNAFMPLGHKFAFKYLEGYLSEKNEHIYLNEFWMGKQIGDDFDDSCIMTIEASKDDYDLWYPDVKIKYSPPSYGGRYKVLFSKDKENGKPIDIFDGKILLAGDYFVNIKHEPGEHGIASTSPELWMSGRDKFSLNKADGQKIRFNMGEEIIRIEYPDTAQSSLNLKVNDIYGDYSGHIGQVELYKDQKETPFLSLSSNKDFSFKHLPQGSYYIKLTHIDTYHGYEFWYNKKLDKENAERIELNGTESKDLIVNRPYAELSITNADLMIRGSTYDNNFFFARLFKEDTDFNSSDFRYDHGIAFGAKVETNQYTPVNELYLAKDSNFLPFDSQKHGRIFPGKYYLGFYVGERFKYWAKPFKWLKMDGGRASLTDKLEEASLIDFGVDEKKELPSEDIFPMAKRSRYFNITIKGENIAQIPNIERAKLRFYVPRKHNPDNDFFVESKETLNINGAAKEKVYHPAFVISDKWLLAIKLGYDKIYYFKGEQRKDIVNYFTGEFTTNRDEAYEFEPNNSHINDYEVTIKNWKLLNKKE